MSFDEIMKMLSQTQTAGQIMDFVSPIAFTTISAVNSIKNKGDREMAANNLAGRLSKDTNPFMKDGGVLKGGSTFKEFKGPKHEDGGIPINKNMGVDLNVPIAEVEGDETGYKSKNLDYIFTDSWEDPRNPGKTFADQSKKIERKYKRDDDISNNTRNIEMMELSKRNERLKSILKQGESLMMKYGGSLKKYANGGPFAEELKKLGYSETEIDDIISSGIHDMDQFSNMVSSNRQSQSIGNVDSLPKIEFKAGFDYGSPSDFKQIEKLPSPMDQYMSKNSIQNKGQEVIDNIDPSGFGLTDVNPKSDDINYNAIAKGMKGGALLFSAIDAAQGSEQEPLQLNPAAAEVRQIMESRGIDFTPLMNEVNRSKNEAVRNAQNISGNVSMYQVLGQNAVNAAGRASANVRMQEQQANNQYRAEEAQVKADLGTEERMERIRQQDIQARNDAARRGMARAFFSNLSQVGTEYNKKQYVEDQIKNQKEIVDLTVKEGLTILGTKYKDFGISEDAYERLLSGEYTADDIIKMYAATQKVK